MKRVPNLLKQIIKVTSQFLERGREKYNKRGKEKMERKRGGKNFLILLLHLETKKKYLNKSDLPSRDKKRTGWERLVAQKI